MLLPVKNCGQGLNKDLLPSELVPGFWSDSLNVEYVDGFARQRRGIQSVYTTPTVIPYYLQTFITSTSRFIVQASTAKVFVDDGSTRTEITNATPYTGGRDNRWTGGDLNGTLVLNNGVDTPQYWNGNPTTTLAPLTAWPAGYKADSLRPFKSFLVGGAITIASTKYPYRVLWSDAADPGAIPAAYIATTSNQAGQLDLTGAGAYVDCLQLGDENILYFQEGRFAMQYVGGTQVFNFNRLPGKDGLRMAGGVVQTPKGHVFLSNGDVMLHNGGEAVSIAQGRVRDWLFSTIDSTNSARAFLALSPQRSEVWIVFPSTGQSNCDTAAVWNWTNDSWARHSLPSVTYGTSGLVASTLSGGTIDGDTAPIDSDVTTNDQDEYSSTEARLILATATPKIGLANTGSTDFGTAFTYYAERKGIRPSDTGQNLILRASRWAFDGTAGTTASIYHGASKTADGEPSYSEAATHTQGTSDWVNRFANRGRYLAVKFSGTSGQQLSLRSFELDIRESGKF